MVGRLPNVLTALRIAAVPVLVWLLLDLQRVPFASVLIACLVGDVIDGQLARALGATSPLGALLDSTADTLLLFVAAGGVVVFFPEVLRTHPVAFSIVPSAWLAENLAAVARYGRLSSFHTRLSRAAGVAMGIYITVLFGIGHRTVVMYAAVGLLLLATLEEFVLLYLLPQWTTDVGSVYEVLTARRRGQQGRSR